MIFILPSFQPRETRRPVSLPARIRMGDCWSDAEICNISTHGMLIESAMPSSRGDVVEIRRGQVCVMARVAWTRNGKFGVRSQNRISLEDLIMAPGLQRRQADDGTLIERRSERRPEAPIDHKRGGAGGKLFQFASRAGFALIVGVVIAVIIWETLYAPSGVSNAVA